MARPKGMPCSPEARAKIGAGARKAMADPAIRQKHIMAQRRRHGSGNVPDHLWADYQTLQKKGYSAAEALKALGISAT